MQKGFACVQQGGKPEDAGEMMVSLVPFLWLSSGHMKIRVHINIGKSKTGGDPMVSIADKVKGIVVKQLEVSTDQVTPEARFVEDLGADSLDQVEVVMALEEAFGIEIPDADAENLATVEDAIRYIEGKKK